MLHIYLRIHVGISESIATNPELYGNSHKSGSRADEERDKHKALSKATTLPMTVQITKPWLRVKGPNSIDIYLSLRMKGKTFSMTILALT